MFRVTISVNKHDGDGPETFIVGLLQGDTSTSGIHWLFDRTVGKHPLVNLDDMLVQHVRQHDLECENVRTSLVADSECICKSTGDGEQGPLTFTLEQRIGGNRGAHFYSVDDTVRNHVCAVQTENIANALYRRILVVLRVFGQQFAARQGIVRTAGHEISKGAPNIYPNSRRHSY